MRTVRQFVVAALICIIPVCSDSEVFSLNTANAVLSAPPPKMKRVSNRKANPKGNLLITEYHRIEPKEGAWTRSSQNFRKDLERLYKWGFRPITMMEYVTKSFRIPPGATPIAITFDDSSEGQFRILPTGQIDPNCAVGIWLDFAKDKPDFPLKATWYMLPKIAFGQKKLVAKKIQMLQQWGSEIGSHTMTHRSLKTLSDETVKKELAESIEYWKKFGVEIKTIAVPYGVLPRDPSVLKGFTYNGKKYRYEGVTFVGSRPAYGPNNPRFDPYKCWRVIGYGGELGDMWWGAQFAEGKSQLYVQP